MDTKALPQKTLAIWEKGGLSALNRHTVVRRCTNWPAFAAVVRTTKAAVFVVLTLLSICVSRFYLFGDPLMRSSLVIFIFPP
jgi:hypothetical protein